MIQVFILLKLYFGKENNLRIRMIGGQKDSINPKGGFLDFYRIKAVLDRIIDQHINKFKKKSWNLFEQPIKN
jgi:hypothetical protein